MTMGLLDKALRERDKTSEALSEGLLKKALAAKDTTPESDALKKKLKKK